MDKKQEQEKKEKAIISDNFPYRVAPLGIEPKFQV